MLPRTRNAVTASDGGELSAGVRRAGAGPCPGADGRTGARLYQPEVHECRAHLARLRGDAAAAQHELDAARRLYAELGATAQIERLAKEMEGRSMTKPFKLSDVDPREATYGR
jgi:hypothetical protein